MPVENLQIRITTPGADAALRSLTGISNALNRISTAARGLNNVNIGINRVGTAARNATKHTNNFLSSLMRIAKYRFFRSIIKSITKAFSEGLEKAYIYSTRITTEGHRFAATLDQMQSKTNQMKGQIGSAFAALLTAIEPIIEKIINLIIKVADSISQLLSAFTGKTYLKAVATTAEFADSSIKGAKAAKEWKNQLLSFDEINRLEDKSTSGKEGNDPLKGYSFEDTPIDEKYLELANKLKEFANRIKKILDELGSRIKLNIKDVFFNWDNLNPESIAKKAIVGLTGLLGGAVGFMLGGVPGAIVGTLTGVAIGLLIDSVIFDNDGVLSNTEIADMLCGALFGLVGGLIGFVVGGPGGALIGASVGIGIFAALKTIDFIADGKYSNLLDQLATALTILAGAMIGFFVGGPAGAAIGAVVGIGISAAISSLKFDVTDHKYNQYKNGLDWFTLGVLHMPTDEQWKQWGKTVIEWIADGFSEFTEELHWLIGDPIERIMEKIKTSLKNDLDEIKQKFSTKFSEIKQKFSKDLDEIKQLFNVTWSFPKIKMPHFSWTWQQVGKWVSIPRISVEWYAKGGFPDMGQLFVANEAGPEMVGTIGGHTAVATNSDIVEAVKAGVYDAVSSAMANNSGNGTIVMNVNGREFMRATYNDRKAVDKEKGISLITNFA